MSSDKLRYYPPEKQGLRLNMEIPCLPSIILRYYPPEKQGLRLTVPSLNGVRIHSDTILQKNKD